MLGKVEWWSPERSDRKTRGYGFLVVRFEDGHLEKFFALGNRLLFESRPQVGDEVSFDATDEKPTRDKGYPLAANIRLVKSANFDILCKIQNPLGGFRLAPPADETPLGSFEAFPTKNGGTK